MPVSLAQRHKPGRNPITLGMNSWKAAAWATSIGVFVVFIYNPDRKRLARQTADLSFPATPPTSELPPQNDQQPRATIPKSTR